MNSNQVTRQIYNNIINDYKLTILSEMTNNTDSYYTKLCLLLDFYLEQGSYCFLGGITDIFSIHH